MPINTSTNSTSGLTFSKNRIDNNQILDNKNSTVYYAIATSTKNGHYVGEIKVFAHTNVPKGWLPCNGQLVNVEKYPLLFSVLLSKYGGNGISTFALPSYNIKPTELEITN